MADRVALVRSELGGPGIRRRRHGRGFRYLGPDGQPVGDPEVLARIKALVIPPAWEDVWICATPAGHIQAVGTDAAGRRQYRYHDLWREQRDREKHDRVLEFGAALPRVRKVVLQHLEGPTLSRDRVLAAAIRLVNLGFFRPGGDEYAGGERHLRPGHHPARSTSPAAGEASWSSTTSASPRSTASKRSRTSGCAPWSAASSGAGTAGTACSPTAADRAGTTSPPPTSTTICARCPGRLHRQGLPDLACHRARGGGPGRLGAGRGFGEHRTRAIARMVREVSDYLGNTPAVARASYIDPRVIESTRRAPRSRRRWGGWASTASSGNWRPRGGRGRGPAAAVRVALDLA